MQPVIAVTPVTAVLPTVQPELELELELELLLEELELEEELLLLVLPPEPPPLEELELELEELLLVVPPEPLGVVVVSDAQAAKKSARQPVAISFVVLIVYTFA